MKTEHFTISHWIMKLGEFLYKVSKKEKTSSTVEIPVETSNIKVSKRVTEPIVPPSFMGEQEDLSLNNEFSDVIERALLTVENGKRVKTHTSYGEQFSAYFSVKCNVIEIEDMFSDDVIYMGSSRIDGSTVIKVSGNKDYINYILYHLELRRISVTEMI